MKSDTLEQFYQQVKQHYGSESQHAAIVRKGLSKTLDSAFQRNDDGTTYVLTGDIPAMWLRDSAAQARPFLNFINDDSELKSLIRGVVESQKKYVLMDPYANAFNRTPNGAGHQTDRTLMSPIVWERKYELDSLCYVLQLSYLYWKASNDSSIFDENYLNMCHLIMEVIEIEQMHSLRSQYRFERVNDQLLFEEPGKLLRESLPNAGAGRAVGFTGMSWCGFRPSDDACHFGYHIPSNMFAVVELNHLAEVLESVFEQRALASKASQLSEQIATGIETHGIVEHPEFGKVYAYEVDGLGQSILMDDANIPSLLSAPYLGYCDSDDPIYQNTRKMLLSESNPYFFSGRFAQGIGSPHTPQGHVWPLSIIMQGLTTNDADEVAHCIDTLCETDADTQLLHESFDCNAPQQFTRPWFSWANCLFAELITKHMAR